MDAIYVPQSLKTVACPLAVRLRRQGSREPTLLCPMRFLAPGAISYLGSCWRGGGSSPDLSVWCDNLGPTISPGSTLKTGQGEECATPKLPLAAPCPPPLGTTRPIYRLLPALGGSRAPGTGINPDFVCVAPREAQGPHGPLWSAHSCQRSQEATTGSLYKAASIQASKKELLHP